LLDLGWDLVQRTAGSHSAVDLIAIDKTAKVIRLIQCKPDNHPSKKIYEDNVGLSGTFEVIFEVI
jgi:hypothetical protein